MTHIQNINNFQVFNLYLSVSSPRPTGHTRPRTAMNVAQHETRHLLKIIFFAHQFLLVFVY